MVLALVVIGLVSWFGEQLPGLASQLLLSAGVVFFIGMLWYAIFIPVLKSPNPNDGEAAVAYQIEQLKQAVYQKLLWLLGCVALAIGSVLVLNLVYWPWNLPLLFLGWTIAAVVGYFVCDQIIRPMADLGWWWVRLDEMTAAFVERDKAFYLCIINCNEPLRRDHFISLAKSLGCQYIILPPGIGIYFLGWTAWPWKIKLRTPWYSKHADEVNPEREPVRFLSLREIPLQLTPEEAPNPVDPKKGEEVIAGVIPTVMTKDPIDVLIWLNVRLEVYWPWAAVYGTQYTGESTYMLILECLRLAITELNYWSEEAVRSGKPDSVGNVVHVMNPQIQLQLNNKLAELLGLNSEPEPEAGKKDPFNLFKSGTAADTILRRFGFLILAVAVKDLQPKDRSLIDSFAKRTVAAAEGAAALTAAEYEKAATITAAQGKAEALRLIREQLNAPGGTIAFQGDMAIRLATAFGGKLVITSGSGGEVPNMINVVGALGGIPISAIGDQVVEAKTTDPEAEKGQEGKKPQGDKGGGKPPAAPASGGHAKKGGGKK